MAQKAEVFSVYVDIDAMTPRNSTSGITPNIHRNYWRPGIFAAARYEAVKGGPKYLACYELENVECCHQPLPTDHGRRGGSGSRRP